MRRSDELTVITSMYLTASSDSHGSPRKKLCSENCVKTLTRWCCPEGRSCLAGESLAESLSIGGVIVVEVVASLPALLRLFSTPSPLVGGATGLLAASMRPQALTDCCSEIASGRIVHLIADLSFQ